MLRIIFLIILLLFSNFIVPSSFSATKVTAEHVVPSSSREEGRQRMVKLVEKFKHDPNAQYLTEAQTRQFDLDEFLRC